MRHSIQLLLLPALFFCFSSVAQNLVANGDFEDINICTEYNSPCANEAWFHYPSINPGPGGNLPHPVSGRKFDSVVMESYSRPVTGRIYLYTGLLCPLEAGRPYQLRFFVNPGRKKTFSLGAAFSTAQLAAPHPAPMDLVPQLNITEKQVIAQGKDGWMEISAPYTATGGEKYLILGNFESTPRYPGKKDKSLIRSVYLIDQVSFESLQKNYPPCPDMEQTKWALYDQNYRHTPNPPADANAVTPDTLLQVLDTLETESEEWDSTEIDIAPPAEAPAMTFTIPDIGFDFGKYTLTPAAYPVLETCYQNIQNIHPTHIKVLGFTDNIGSEAFNLDLSGKRAQSVCDWLCKRYHLSPALFDVEGLGESRPIADNDTEDGRKANRRVEIQLIP